MVESISEVSAALLNRFVSLRARSNLLNLVGSFVLIVYTYPWAGLIFIPVVVFFVSFG